MTIQPHEAWPAIIESLGNSRILLELPPASLVVIGPGPADAMDGPAPIPLPPRGDVHKARGSSRCPVARPCHPSAPTRRMVARSGVIPARQPVRIRLAR